MAITDQENADARVARRARPAGYANPGGRSAIAPVAFAQLVMNPNDSVLAPFVVFPGIEQSIRGQVGSDEHRLEEPVLPRLVQARDQRVDV